MELSRSQFEDRRISPLMGPDYFSALAKHRDGGNLLSRAALWHLGQTQLGGLLESKLPGRTTERINRLSALKLAYAARNRAAIKKALEEEHRDKQAWADFTKDFSNYAQRHGKFGVLQIGANDGKTFDRLFPVVSRHPEWQITLVEPMDDAFGRLSQNYAGHPGATMIQAAIVEQPGPVTMHYVIQDAAAWENIDTVATTKPQTLQAYKEASFQTGCVEVRGQTLRGLSDEDGIDLGSVDLLFIDAEGCDYAILTQAIAECAMRPAFIVAEHDHMSPAEFADSLKLLGESGYQTKAMSNDFIARRQAVMSA